MLRLLKTVIRAINGLKTGGSTAIGRGLQEAETILKCARSSALKRVVLLTDGHQNHDVSPREVANRLLNAGVRIDCIGIGNVPNDVDEKLLCEIASRDENGARYRFISARAELVEHFRKLAMSITR